ncbi:unnamed protein product [Heligmosomoides polygyrus]|uniref:Secreted protein n=1 Tax=Heligmosomoides polygyrus TaxID=6339 RepID=A0A183FLX7_HELPZ|nr:unnamed protein product [Heligmosomoides polygyrus]
MRVRWAEELLVKLDGGLIRLQLLVVVVVAGLLLQARLQAEPGPSVPAVALCHGCLFSCQLKICLEESSRRLLLETRLWLYRTQFNMPSACCLFAGFSFPGPASPVIYGTERGRTPPWSSLPAAVLSSQQSSDSQLVHAGKKRRSALMKPIQVPSTF